MQNFIEVVLFKDQSVIDGIIHGTYHRSKQENGETQIPSDEAKDNILYYVDVTENAAKSSLYCTLRRDPLFDTIPIGIFQPEHLIRGRTLIRPTFIFSDNLTVLDKDKLINALVRLAHSVWNATSKNPSQIRFIASEYLSEKFIYCINEAMYRFFTDRIQQAAGKNYMPNVDDLEPNISNQEFFECFFDKNLVKGRVKELEYVVLSHELCSLISDEMITRVAGTLRVNKIGLYIPTDRYRKFVMRNCISISGAIV